MRRVPTSRSQACGSAFVAEAARASSTKLAFDEQGEDDKVFESHGLKLLVESVAFEYVDGSQIDYVEALTGAGFKVENPNVVAACGCGSSFRVADQESCSPA
jgi:iron-sulfur cluster assembly protein